MQNGHTSTSLKFYCFIFTPVLQKSDACLVIQMLRSKGSLSLASLITVQSIVDPSDAGNRPVLYPILDEGLTLYHFMYSVDVVTTYFDLINDDSKNFRLNL